MVVLICLIEQIIRYIRYQNTLRNILNLLNQSPFATNPESKLCTQTAAAAPVRSTHPSLALVYFVHQHTFCGGSMAGFQTRNQNTHQIIVVSSYTRTARAVKTWGSFVATSRAEPGLVVARQESCSAIREFMELALGRLMASSGEIAHS